MTRNRRLFLLALATFLVLAGTAEERLFGTISDEQQMLDTAVALAEHGEIGIARGQTFVVPRPAGDAVSPYGMGLPLLEAPVCLVAGRFERAFGWGASQALFVLEQCLLVLSAGLAAALLVRALGGSPLAEAGALSAAIFASPLWAYASAGYSEPLQAAALTGAVASAAFAARARRPAALAVLAGLLAGGAVLAKGINVPLAALVLSPLLLDGEAVRRERLRRLGLAAAGASVPLGAWLAFELARFGRPLSSYGGQGFTNPPLDGLWRLLVGANKGLILYFPLLVVSLLGLALLARGKGTCGSALAVTGVFGVLLLTSAAWFAWDGTGGWGPRFLVPAVPGLAAAGALSVRGRPRLARAAIALGVSGTLVNLLGVLQNETASSYLVASTADVPVSREEAARFPPYYVHRDAAGDPLVPRVFYAGKESAFSPLRLHLFLLRARLGERDPDALARRVASPPWLERRPDLPPRLVLHARVVTTYGLWSRYLVTPFRWPRLGSVLSLDPDERRASVNPAWQNGLRGQLLRDLDVGKAARAVPLGWRLWDLAPSGFTAALLLDALRLSGDREGAARFVQSLAPGTQAAPTFLLARALVARDAGDEAGARALLTRARAALPLPGIDRALAGAWPRTLHGLTTENLDPGSAVALPRIGR